MDRRNVLAEFIGTLLYVFFAVGAPRVAAQYIGAVGVALAFGLVLVGLAYVFGAVSGCHLNPAVTLGSLLARRIGPMTAVAYWVAQFVGAIAGGALLFLLVKQIPGLQTYGAFGSNGYATRSAVGINTGGAFLIEVAMTFLLVFVYLTVTRRVAGQRVRRAGRRPDAGRREPGRHPAHRRRRQPGAQPRHGGLRRRRRAVAAVAVHRRAAGRRRPGRPRRMITHPHGALPVVTEGAVDQGGRTGDDVTAPGDGGAGPGAGAGAGEPAGAAAAAALGAPPLTPARGARHRRGGGRRGMCRGRWRGGGQPKTGPVNFSPGPWPGASWTTDWSRKVSWSERRPSRSSVACWEPISGAPAVTRPASAVMILRASSRSLCSSPSRPT